MLTLRERPRSLTTGAARCIADLPQISMDSDHYASIGFLRSVQMAARKHGPVLNLRFDRDGNKVLLGEAGFGDAWRRHSRQLVKDVDDYPAPASLARMLLDNNLTTAREGAEWEDMRAQFAPLMRYKMHSYAEAVEAAAEQMIESLSRTDPDRPSLWSVCGTWSAQTVAHPVLGFSFTDDMVLDLVNALRQCMFHLVQESPGKDRAALLNDDQLLKMRARLGQLVHCAIRLCRPGDDTMVGHLLDLRGVPRGSEAAPEVVADLQPILIGALAATVHNNSLGMFWTMMKLAQHPQAAAAVAAEARQGKDAPWHLNTAPVALAAVREALRINPVLPFIERKATADLDLNGLSIPRGTTVVFSPWIVHRDPRDWPDPMNYDLTRFTNGERVDLTRWFPFGLGHRACIGSNLALNQIARSITLICDRLSLSIPRQTLASYWQPTYRVLLEPREDGGVLTAVPRP
ncbi:cytochrome P450 [Tropicibacter oceani]|uniref:Cytochrome P450 n=1 Tax=Tropicibacter oceani TaxID=3058420 RepID=A0ABY8QIQ4_9RHOB|nr:cytochrome P450 [Tropicibacter oceani]WGW04514.1 cytochrome P450 [Tropicibacter oceani]